MDLIALNGLLLDTRRPLETLARMAPEDLFGLPGSSFMDPLAGLYLVQFAAPVQDLWRNELEELGVEILQYMSMNAYVVQAGIDQVLALQNLVRNEMHVQYVGAYEPGFRMTPSVRRALEGDLQEPRSVTIQLIAGDDPRSSVQTVAGLVDEILGYKVVGPWVNVHAMVRPLVFREIASNPRVFQIEKRGVAVYHDEAQGQIVAGNLSGNSPSGPGYLSWLSSQGFTSSQFGSFSVNVVDDATSLTGHPDLASSRVAFSQNPTGQSGSQGGHGFLNAHIVSGLNSGTGSSAEDANGYNYGLGIAPWSQVGSTAIFGSGSLDPTSYESSAYGLGARISTNSWSFQSGGSPIADYDSNSQEFDFITRDAQSGTSGNQEYFVIFAAGNSGSGSNTVSTPSTAKNILTVGASENVRMTGTDGCAISNSGANSANDIIGFSRSWPRQQQWRRRPLETRDCGSRNTHPGGRPAEQLQRIQRVQSILALRTDTLWVVLRNKPLDARRRRRRGTDLSVVSKRGNVSTQPGHAQGDSGQWRRIHDRDRSWWQPAQQQSGHGAHATHSHTGLSASSHGRSNRPPDINGCNLFGEWNSPE